MELTIEELDILLLRERAAGWSEGYYTVFIEDYEPFDKEEMRELRDRADSRNPYKNKMGENDN